MADKKIVLLTDGTEAEFPIRSSLADIDKRLAAEGLERDTKSKPFAERGAVEKAVGKAALPVVEGVSGILGLPGEVKKSLDVGGSELAKLFGFSPEQYQAAKKYLDVGGQVKQMVGADKLPSMEMPTSGQITDLARQAGIPMERAETAPGRLAQTFVRNVVGAPVKAALIPSAVSAVGEESLGGVFAGTPLEPYARMAGGVGLPLLLSPLAAKSPLERMYAESTQRMTPQEVQAASQLQKQSFQAGMPVTSFEAMQQAAKGKTTLPSLQRQVEATPASAPAMQEFMASRGAQTQKTLETRFPATTREQMGTQVQRAAKAEERALQTQIVQEGGGAFEAIKGKKIPQSWMTNLENESAVISEAAKAVDTTPAYRDMLKGYETNSIARIEAMRSFLQDKYKTLAGVNPGEVTNEMRIYDQARRDLLKKADLQIPEYKTARADYDAIRERVQAPVRESPIPKLALTSELPQQFGDMFATKAVEIGLTPKKVTMAVEALAKTDPTLPKDFLTQYMRASLENVQRAASTQAGTVGARFVDTIAKNTTQRENLRAAFKGVYGDKGNQAVNGLNKMMDILEAQGRRLPSGSPTAEKGMLAEASVGQIGRTLKQPLSAVGDLYQNIFFGQDYNRIAKAITSPDGVMALEKLAKASKDQKKIGLAITEINQVIKANQAEEALSE
jgi:hypothetical protein